MTSSIFRTFRPSRRALLAAALLGVLAPLGGLRADDTAKPAAPATAPPAAPAAPAPPPPAGPATEFVLMSTSKGDVVLELFRDKAPLSVENFLGYVDKGFYDGTIFHRVIPNFMIQGGGFTPDMKQKPTGPAIKNEGSNGLANARGTIAMARLPQPDTATSQFFINVRDNTSLNFDAAANRPGYAVFGKVLGPMDAVESIRVTETKRSGPHEALPVETVTIVKVSRITPDEAKKAVEAATAKAAEAAKAAAEKAAEAAKDAVKDVAKDAPKPPVKPG